ncbi:MAG: imidazole glycerol phosphate synthase subunit HisH [Rickettsiales bacterium]
MIVVVNYGVGNLSSVHNMLRKAGADVMVSDKPSDILAANKLLLPGVGHFDYGMKMLNESGLRAALDTFALELKKPVLGICLGAQILGKGSEEGSAAGLGWIDMVCKRIPAAEGLRVPHMGWNKIQRVKPTPLLDGVTEDARYYFVHSYYMQCAHSEDIAATANHGITFTCAVAHNTIFGTQFHPEKSLRHGLALMKAFVEMPHE